MREAKVTHTSEEKARVKNPAWEAILKMKRTLTSNPVKKARGRNCLATQSRCLRKAWKGASKVSSWASKALGGRSERLTRHRTRPALRRAFPYSMLLFP